MIAIGSVELTRKTEDLLSGNSDSGPGFRQGSAALDDLPDHAFDLAEAPGSRERQDTWTRAERSGKKARRFFKALNREARALADSLEETAGDVLSLEKAVVGDTPHPGNGCGGPPVLVTVPSPEASEARSVGRYALRPTTAVRQLADDLEIAARRVQATYAEVQGKVHNVRGELESLGRTVGELNGAIVGDRKEPGADAGSGN